MKRTLYSVFQILALAGYTAAWTAGATGAAEPIVPRHQEVLGSETYITMPLQKLARPITVWGDIQFLLQHNVFPNQVLDRFGYASSVEGENAADYH